MDLLVNKTSIMSYQCDLLSLSQSLIITHTHTHKTNTVGKEDYILIS